MIKSPTFKEILDELKDELIEARYFTRSDNSNNDAISERKYKQQIKDNKNVFNH